MINPHIRRFAFLTAILSMAVSASAMPVATNLELWLDASTIDSSTTSVSTWADQSGNGRDATASGTTSTPTYVASNPFFSNRPTVSFDGSDMLSSALGSTMNITGSSARTIFVVFSKDSSASRNMLGYGANSSLALFDIAIASQKVSGHFYGTPFVSGSQTVSLNQMTVGAVRYTGTAFETFLYDASSTGQTSSTPYALNTLDSTFNIGAGTYSNYNGFDGDIAELLVYSAALSDSDLRDVNDYLNTKYTTQAAVVPEPASLALTGIALAGLAISRRRKQAK